ncbi:MAG: DNA repair protein RecO, partial [Primorskyibacter sp.]
MEWQDTGILLTRRKHGESSVIIEVLTPQRGRHAGIVRGGTSRKIAPHLQPGTQLSLHWRARLEDHVGSFVIEPQRSRASAMANRLSLAGLNAVTGLLSFTLPEREACPALYQRTERLLDLLPQVDLWPLAYLQWEVALLADLGFALDLERCAVTGARDGLVYVSPRTGRAVSVRG